MPFSGDDVIGLVSTYGMGDCSKQWDRLFEVRDHALDRFVSLEDDRALFAYEVTEAYPESAGAKSIPASPGLTSAPTPALREAALSSRHSGHPATVDRTPGPSIGQGKQRSSSVPPAGPHSASVAHRGRKEDPVGERAAESLSARASTAKSAHSSVHSMTDWLELDQYGQPRGA